MDSIGKARHYDQKLKIAQSLLSYRYPISWYDIDVNRIVDFNRVEGLRLGIGAHTNDSLMKWASIGGYAALGTRDQEFKFGGDIAFNIYPKKDVKLIYAYSNDVEPPANTQNMYPKAPWLQNMSRNRMDKSDRHDISFESRLFKYFTSALTYRHEVREPFYNRPEHNLSSYPSFSITELRLKARFAYKERIIESFGRKFSKGTNYPILNFGITKGLSQWGGSYDYTRLQAGIEKRFLGIVTGETKVLLEGGLAFGDVPYFALFDGNGTLMPAQLLWIRNTFQTMRPYEFLSDKYVSIFVQQRLKPILKRFHSEYFAPEPTLYFNYGIGNLNKSQPDQTLIPDFKIMSKGFSEAGCIINNVLRFEYMGLTYLGVGMGAFMRTGYYQEKRIGNNIVYKISFTLSFN